MDTKTFESFLRELQKSEKDWPNKVFAWLQPNYKLFLVATASGRPYELLTYQYDIGSETYGNHRYGIDPRITYLKPGNSNQTYCPVDALVSKVSGFEFLGEWEDLSKKVSNITPATALRRWDEAKAQIPGCEQVMNHKSLNDTIYSAVSRAANLSPSPASPSHISKAGEAVR